MNPLELTLIRIGFLAVLWLFVIAAVGVVRTDLFGPARQRRRRSGAGAQPALRKKKKKKIKRKKKRKNKNKI